MELQLKHLSPYLPYGLKIFVCENECEMTIEDEMDSETICLRDVIENYHKPMLRPLSDLNNEITVGDNKICPIDYLEEKYYTLDLHKQCERIMEDSRWINHCEYILIQYLLEWHFDVNDLIENNLAIDINSIKNK